MCFQTFFKAKWNEASQRMKCTKEHHKLPDCSSRAKPKHQRFDERIFMFSSIPFLCLVRLLKWNVQTRLSGDVRWRSQKWHCLQVLFDNCVHDHLKDDLDVGGVRRRGEVVVDELAGRGVERNKGGGDKAGGRIHVAVCAWKREEGGIRPYSETSASSAQTTDTVCQLNVD